MLLQINFNKKRYVIYFTVVTGSVTVKNYIPKVLMKIHVVRDIKKHLEMALIKFSKTKQNQHDIKILLPRLAVTITMLA